MEEEGVSVKKKPLSLNQRHSRLLGDLSASRSKPPPPSSSPREGMEQSKFKLDRPQDFVVDDIPSFSGIADFDSSPDVAKLSKEKPIKNNEATDDTVPRFSGIADFDSSSDKSKPEKQKMKPEKVKIEGRRRLCKVSSQNDDNDDYKYGNNQFHDISDFISPSQTRELGSNVDGGGGNEIRDILNDLSSRLEFLSIEKQRNRRSVDLRTVLLDDDPLDVRSHKGVDQKKAEMGEPEFASAGSSFAGSSDRSGSSSGAAGSFQNRELESQKWGESEGDNFVRVVKTTNVDKGKLRVVNKKENRNPVFSRRKFVSHLKDEEQADEDDCIVLGSGKLPKKDRLECVSNRDYDHSSAVQVLDDDADENVSENDHAQENVSEDDHAITLSGRRSTYKLPAKIGKMLYPHQRDGLRWLWSLHCQGKGGILGDDMGLGKTMQISGYLAGLFNSRLIKRVMIVAPKTLIPHWMKELSVVGLSQKIREYFGTNAKLREYELQYVLQDKGILLTTYDIVRNNAKQLSGSGFYEDDNEDDLIWDYMILDEGHLIKNPSTQRAKSLLEIPCAHRIVISGTPIQNNLKELWALFNFCCPDLLGDKKWFKDKYEHPILRGNDKNASERDKRVGSMVAKELRERIQPYFLRRLKNEVFREDGDKESAKLSKKNEIIVWLRLTSCQRHLYEAFLKSEIVLSAFDGSPLAAITVF